MNTTPPVEPDFSPAEVAELATGAQTFLFPAADPRDDERLVQTELSNSSEPEKSALT